LSLAKCGGSAQTDDCDGWKSGFWRKRGFPKGVKEKFKLVRELDLKRIAWCIGNWVELDCCVP